jgi:rsbT antagonist protein RsbS
MGIKMNNSVESIKISIHETQGCLIASIQEELSCEAAQQIQRSLLEQVHGKSVKGVIIDLSGVNIIDGALWEIISKTAQMVKMLGAPSVITGLSPGVVASIIDLNLEINGLTTAMNLKDALEILTQSAEPEADDDYEAENEDGNFETDDELKSETENDVDNEYT